MNRRRRRAQRRDARHGERKEDNNAMQMKLQKRTDMTKSNEHKCLQAQYPSNYETGEKVSSAN